MSTALISQNVTVSGRRTSLRLEATMWDGLREIARREHLTIHDLCTLLDQRLKDWEASRPLVPGQPKRTLAGAVRVFISAYFRRATTEAGHEVAGHGRGHPLVGTPFEHATAPDDHRGLGA